MGQGGRLCGGNIGTCKVRVGLLSPMLGIP